MDIKHPVWTALLFICSITYLAFELAFNSRLVDAASGMFTVLQIQTFELEGRILSGLGLTLLLLRRLKSNTWLLFIKQCVIYSVFGFSLMFFGQKILVGYLVDNSSTQNRVDAQYISLLKKGILTNSIQLDDLKIAKEELNSPATKAMTSIMGAMIFNSSTFVSHLKGSIDLIIDETATNDAQQSLIDTYKTYQDYQQHTLDAWQRYAQGSQNYYLALQLAENTADEKTVLIYLEATNEWNKAQNKLDNKAIIRKSLEIKRAVSDYFEAKRLADKYCSKYKLTEQKCHIKIEQVYRDTVVKESGRYVPPDYWCYKAVENMVVKNIRGKKISVATTEQDCQTMTRDWFEQKMLQLMPGSSGSLLDSRKAASKVRAELIKQEIVLPASWTMRDRDQLKEQIFQHAERKVNESYKVEIVNAVGEFLAPDLSQVEFLNHPLIQEPLQSETGWDKDQPMSLSMSPDAFLEQVIKPKFVAEYQNIKSSLLQDGIYFGDGMSKEQQGKNYYRGIIVPPLAMSFSLFFGLLNLFAFVTTIGGFLTKRKYLPQVLAASSLGVVFVAYPLGFPSKTVESDSFKYFQAQLNQDYPKPLSGFAAWVVDTQPIVYPIGHLASTLLQHQKMEQYIAKHRIKSTKQDSLVDAYKPVSTPEYQTAKPVSTIEPPSPSNPHVSEKTSLDTMTKNTGVKTVPNSTFTLRRQNQKSAQHWAHSLALVEESLPKFDGIMFDLSPIGHPKDENWVVYDKKRFGKDVCILGRREYDSLYHMSEAIWKTSMNGDCSDNWENGSRMPSVAAYVRQINKLNTDGKQIIISLNESILGEVYCQRYVNIINQLSTSLHTDDLVWSTPSLSILGCFYQLPATDHTAFELPHYQGNAKALKLQNHQVLSMKEWRRIKRVESGANVTLSEIPHDQLNQLLTNHPFLDQLIVDEPLISKQLTGLLNEKSLQLLSIKDTELTRRTF
jgi:hypothetical protein